MKFSNSLISCVYSYRRTGEAACSFGAKVFGAHIVEQYRFLITVQFIGELELAAVRRDYQIKLFVWPGIDRGQKGVFLQDTENFSVGKEAVVMGLVFE